MFALGLPMIAVWVIGMPLIALFIIVKHRRHLEEWRLRKYMLLLYQGLKPSVFYWEFVNTFRKLLILMIITFMSQIKVSFQVLVSLICIMILLRLQLRLQPYKIEENNKIEILGTISSIITMSSLVLLAEDDSPAGFAFLATILMFTFNIVFVLQWMFLFMLSWNIKHPYFKTFLKIFSVFIWKRNLLNEEEQPVKREITCQEAKKGNKMRKIKKRAAPKSTKASKQRRRKIQIEDTTIQPQENITSTRRGDRTPAELRGPQFVVHENEFKDSWNGD